MLGIDFQAWLMGLLSVLFAKRKRECLSLKIGYVAVLEGSEYCEDCNSTNIGKAPIEEWDKMFFNKYGYHYLEEFKDK